MTYTCTMCSDTKTEVIPATGHAYGEPVWKWNDDFTASATFTCGNDASHVETVNATVTNAVTTEATCMRRTACGPTPPRSPSRAKEYTDAKTEVIPATGHAYGAPVWKWTDGFEATATFTCGNDASHVENVTATVTNAVTTEATCEVDGVRTYTAKVTFEDKGAHRHQDGRSSPIGPYGEPVWKWNMISPLLTFTCGNDASRGDR